MLTMIPQPSIKKFNKWYENNKKELFFIELFLWITHFFIAKLEAFKNVKYCYSILRS